MPKIFYLINGIIIGMTGEYLYRVDKTNKWAIIGLICIVICTIIILIHDYKHNKN